MLAMFSMHAVPARADGISGASTAAKSDGGASARAIGSRGASARANRSGGASLSALDLIELQISYTTLMARYYRPVQPRILADGARTGIAAELLARGVSGAELPYTPAHVDFGDGEDFIDALVLRNLALYGARLDGHRLVEAAVAGELGALRDPYTVLFRPQQFKKFNAYLGNESFGGIGAMLSFDAAKGRALVERVLPDGPAAAAGLRGGDIIVAIDARPTAALGAAGLRGALRGKIGSSVRVAVLRDGAPQTLTIVRAEVSDPEVRSELFGDVGYVALARFGDRAGVELAAALRALRARHATSFVLDVRGNGGGYGDQATAVAALFLSGPVFTTRDRNGTTTVSRATMKEPFTGRLALLVDGDTASAAEIVAGALQDAGSATIVGQRTFGKGLVQSVFPLPDGSALKITTARYTTPRGRDIDRVGILPDVVVAEPPGSVRGDPARDVVLARALDLVHAPAPNEKPTSAP